LRIFHHLDAAETILAAKIAALAQYIAAVHAQNVNAQAAIATTHIATSIAICFIRSDAHTTFSSDRSNNHHAPILSL